MAPGSGKEKVKEGDVEEGFTELSMHFKWEWEKATKSSLWGHDKETST